MKTTKKTGKLTTMYTSKMGVETEMYGVKQNWRQGVNAEYILKEHDGELHIHIYDLLWNIYLYVYIYIYICICICTDDWTKMYVDSVCPGTPTHILYSNDKRIHQKLRGPLQKTTIQLYHHPDAPKKWEEEGM